MGGKSSVQGIVDWISKREKELGTSKKQLLHKVHAILSSKKYQSVWTKEPTGIGKQITVWKLASNTAKPGRGRPQVQTQ